MTTVAMFPLGSVLMPHMPLPLRVFESRYLEMLRVILADEPSEFGVVLIERGQEVGGGDVRVDLGTLAQIGSIDTSGESILLIAQGVRRIRVTRWIDEAVYPQADVEDLPDPAWSPELAPLLERADRAVRRVLREAEEAGEELRWPADVGLDDDPAAAAWQLAAIAPLGPLDQLDLLGSTSIERLLRRTIELTEDAEALYT
ncbi:LON peptidase substrate-binding domain-containing protein [uncultured Amnibacterium sp.]|uniref:LON peptidase substrate-binding domain-containing protein n=1 Tax=uncultured Amnibacterium sp. TaxID=1631851 RepID=UPI0035CAEA1D